MKVLTFDVEDWFHILDHPETAPIENWSRFESRLEQGVDRILRLLDDFDQRATFFCLGWIAERHPDVIRQISANGHHLGTHSFAHELVYESSPSRFEADLLRSISAIEKASGVEVTAYRAPGFSITRDSTWAFEILAKNGIEVDCSVFPASRAHGGLPSYKSACPSMIQCPNGSLKSLPINTANILGKNFVYSGGGYFRLLPWSFLAHRFCRDDYVMTYFHPRDFDPDQPVLEGLGRIRMFKCYVGLGNAESKLRRLLSDYHFMTVEEAVASINWSTVSSVKIEAQA